MRIGTSGGASHRDRWASDRQAVGWPRPETALRYRPVGRRFGENPVYCQPAPL